MADIDAIRQGLAALLRSLLPADEGHVSPYWRTTPPVPTLHVFGIETGTADDFNDGMDMRFIIEAFVGTVDDIAAQKRLDALVEGMKDAVEADNSASGALFDRLDETGTLTTDVGAAADCVAFVQYRGQQLAERNTTQYLTGIFEIQVIT